MHQPSPLLPTAHGTGMVLLSSLFASLSCPSHPQEKVGSLDHKSPAVQVNFHGGTWSSPLYYQRGQCDLLLMQLPADARCCTSGSGGNLVFAPPARELEARGYFTEPGGGLPRRAAKSPALAIVLWLMPATTKHGRSWPDAAKWIVDLRKEGVFTVLATRAGAADDTDEADLQPYYVDAELARQLQHIVATGEQMAAEKARLGLVVVVFCGRRLFAVLGQLACCGDMLGCCGRLAAFSSVPLLGNLLPSLVGCPACSGGEMPPQRRNAATLLYLLAATADPQCAVALQATAAEEGGEEGGEQDSKAAKQVRIQRLAAGLIGTSGRAVAWPSAEAGASLLYRITACSRTTHWPVLAGIVTARAAAGGGGNARGRNSSSATHPDGQ